MLPSSPSSRPSRPLLPACSSFGLFFCSSSSALPSLVFPSSSRPWEKRLQTVNFRFPSSPPPFLQTASIPSPSARPPSCFDSEKMEGRRRRRRKWRRGGGYVVDGLDGWRWTGAGGRREMLSGGVVHLSIFAFIKRIREEKEGGRSDDFSCKSPLFWLSMK